MVAATSQGFDALFETYEKNYKNITPAEALFWKRWRGGSTYDYGLRVEAPAIMKEFTDGVNLGTDPEGFLLYDSISDFDQDKVYYNIFYSTTTTTEQKAVVVVFWHLEEDAKSVTDPGKDYFATFIAKDPNGVVDYVRASQSGYWKGLQIATANAHVKKHSQKSQIVVTVPSIRKKITFDVDVNTKKEAVDVWGNLSFGDIAKLVSPVVNNSPTKSYADYNSDRITFYPTSGWTGSASFTAFFIPLDSAPKASLGASLAFEAKDVVWADYTPS